MTTDYATTYARSLHLITCTLCSVNIRPTIHTASQLTCWLQACSRTLTATNAFMFTVPVLLLAFDGAVAGVPTAVVHCFRLTVVALKHTKHAHLNWCYQPHETSKTAHVLRQGTGIRDQQWAVLLTTENLLVCEKMMPAGEFLWLSECSVSSGALTLLAGWQEGHPGGKKTHVTKFSSGTSREEDWHSSGKQPLQWTCSNIQVSLLLLLFFLYPR